jgi:hypothetical protein
MTKPILNDGFPYVSYEVKGVGAQARLILLIIVYKEVILVLQIVNVTNKY